MEVTTSTLIKYTASYDNGKLVKVEIDSLTITEDPSEFLIDPTILGTYHTACGDTMSYILDHINATRNKCKEFFDDSDVMRFVCDNLKKVLNGHYQKSQSIFSPRQDIYTYKYAKKCIRDIDVLELVSGTDEFNYIKNWVENPNNAQDELIRIIEYLKDKLYYDNILVDSRVVLSVKKICLLLDSIKRYVNSTKCVAKETIVDTSTGATEIDGIRVNDTLVSMTVNGESTHVKVKSLLSPPTVMGDDKYIIFQNGNLVIKVDKNDKNVAWIGDKYITEFTIDDIDRLDYAHGVLMRMAVNPAKATLHRDFIVRLKYLMYIYPTNKKQYTLMDAICDGKVIIMNVRGTPSTSALKTLFNDFSQSHSYVVWQADLIAYKFDKGYYVAKSRWHKDPYLTTGALISRLLDIQYGDKHEA